MLYDAIFLKTAQPIHFFTPKDTYLIFRQLQKKTEILTGDAKMKSWVQLDPPPPCTEVLKRD